jgi:hypothetical protein
METVGEHALFTLRRGPDFAEARLRQGVRGLQLRLVMWTGGEDADDPHVLWSQTFRDAARSDRAARAVAEKTRREMLTRGWRDVNESVD